MSKKLVALICTTFLTLASASFADTPVPADELTPALGQVANGGPGKYDFRRANHDLRLENLVMNAESDGDGSKITGTFTMTHLYKGIGGIHFRPADHLLVSFTAKGGKTDSTVTPAAGQNPWGYIITAGATAAGAPPQDASVAANAVTKITSMTSGNASPFMAQAVVSLTDRLAALSKRKY